MNKTTKLYDAVADALEDAHLVAWDGCHKIYLAMDEEQADWFRREYPHIVDSTFDVMLNALDEWWDNSCGLRFINAVKTNHADPNAGFTTLIPQFDDEDYDEMGFD